MAQRRKAFPPRPSSDPHTSRGSQCPRQGRKNAAAAALFSRSWYQIHIYHFYIWEVNLHFMI